MPVQDEVQKSRTTITYKTEINGEPATVDLPFRLLILADLSLGTSKDRKLDLDERSPRNLNGSNISEVMDDLKISLDLVVPNKINPESAETVDVHLDIKSLESFSPQDIVKQVPQIQSLILFKKLLEEIQSNIANKKEFAQALNTIYGNPALLAKLREETKRFSPVLPKPQICHSQKPQSGNEGEKS